MARKKITVVGAGHVGEHVAWMCAEKELGDIVLVDIIEDMPQGKALDMREALPLEGWDSNIIGSNGYEETADSDVVVVTSGVPRKPGMSRDELLDVNAKIIKSVTEEVVKYSPNCIMIMVANPLDAMTYLARELSGFAPNRVFGQAGALDLTRLCCFVSMELGISTEDIQAMVMGGHGDTMVPLPRYTTVRGVPITQLMPPERVEALIDRTIKGGGEIVALLKTGSAYYAPAVGTTQMVESVIRDKKRLLPCAAYCQGEYGIKDLYVGVPVIIGANGVEKIVELELDEREKAALQHSADAVQSLVNDMRRMGYVK